MHAARIRESAMQTAPAPFCTGTSSFYITSPLDNPRSVNAKMTNVSDFVSSMLGYIYRSSLERRHVEQKDEAEPSHLEAIFSKLAQQSRAKRWLIAIVVD